MAFADHQEGSNGEIGILPVFDQIDEGCNGLLEAVAFEVGKPDLKPRRVDAWLIREKINEPLVFADGPEVLPRCKITFRKGELLVRIYFERFFELLVRPIRLILTQSRPNTTTACSR